MSAKGHLTFVYFVYSNEKQLKPILANAGMNENATTAVLQGKPSVLVTIPELYDKLRAEIKHQFQLDKNVENFTQFNSKFQLELREETYCFLQKKD